MFSWLSVYATFFHFLCPQRARFFFLLGHTGSYFRDFIFLSFYSQVDEEHLGNGCTWIKSQGTTRKPLCAFPSTYLGLRRAEALSSDISDLTLLRRVCDASVPSQGCLSFLPEPCVCAGVIVLSLASCIPGVSQKI